MAPKRNVTAGTKKLVAGRQRYNCSANVDGYACPLAGSPFDEAGYEIDHILALKEGGTNEESNLQALCLMCHRVKSNRSSVGKPSKAATEKKTPPTPTVSKPDEQIYCWPDDAEKMPRKIQWKKGSDSLMFGLWRQQFGYSSLPDVDGNYSRQH